MRIHLLSPAVFATLLCCQNAAFGATNLVADGNFSSTASTGSSTPEVGFINFLTGSTFGAWSVVSGNVDRVTTLWNAPVSGNTVDLDGNTPGAISQSLSLAPGSYELSFYLSGNPTGNPLTKTLRVQVGDATQTFTYTLPSGINPGNPPFTLSYAVETLNFSTSGPTSLRFSSLDTGSTSLVAGPVVGDISVFAVPEPAAAGLMFVGIGVLAAALGFRSHRDPRAALA